MNVLVILVPVSISLGLLALIGFVWTLRADQYEDLDGDAARALFAEDMDDAADPNGRRNGT